MLDQMWDLAKASAPSSARTRGFSATPATGTAKHWWWRPAWKVGTRFYAWHITLDGQDELHALADKCAATLADVPTPDVVPRQWRHITLQGLGHVEEVDDTRRDAAVDAVRARLTHVAPITSTY